MTVGEPSMCGRCPSHRVLVCAAAAACGRAGPRRAGALAVAWILLGGSAGGQDAVPADRHAPTSAEIQEILKQVDADTALAPDVKARITDEYKKALDAQR